MDAMNISPLTFTDLARNLLIHYNLFSAANMEVTEQQPSHNAASDDISVQAIHARLDRLKSEIFLQDLAIRTCG